MSLADASLVALAEQDLDPELPHQAAGDLAGVTRSLNNIAVVKMELGDTAGSLADRTPHIAQL
ncbi:MAG: hypothetical protein FJZ00_02380 [Candidatus Sericytochromatia bacterium]|uniref:Uncharacterized protein n=1 Tax=Candidatus Tanganyikabacteria bacterium TaxID=2961651 RepID=A0A937X2A2_9BACT|nr:hypothetical protein [Candidatus Tanganyikabacteria bacterium]